MNKTVRMKKPKTKKMERRIQHGTNGGVHNERSRIALAYIELGKDKVFQQLPEPEKFNLVKEALAIGDETAKWATAEYQNNDPRRIAVAMGLKVSGEEEGKSKGSVYHKDKKEIVVFRDYHEKLAKWVDHPQLSDNLLKILVAHELFRHIEHDRIGEVYKRFKFRVWKFGPFIKEKYIKGLSSVAAHAFTLSLLGLDISPKVVDYLAYIMFTK
ncbi:MAG: hypothetical protein QME05_00070 [Candidatus Margulisbacteria bacterium]|nr:hypothetical protein [Candidatus Margulisiibacteriota bacterium]